MKVTSREEGGSKGNQQGRSKVAGWRKGNFAGRSPSAGRVIAPA